MKKVAFLGDPHQLPPYGSPQIHVESVFTKLIKLGGKKRSQNWISSKKTSFVFLSVTYRLPRKISGFLSGKVYGGRLQVHNCRPPDVERSIIWIDIPGGTSGEVPQGKSTKNLNEARAVVRIVKRRGWSPESVAWLTGYDAQRALLVKEFKNEKLPHLSDRVFNVDSFQGNEADHIVISLVRTKKMGFLTQMERANVLFSRCKKVCLIFYLFYFFR